MIKLFNLFNNEIFYLSKGSRTLCVFDDSYSKYFYLFNYLKKINDIIIIFSFN